MEIRLITLVLFLWFHLTGTTQNHLKTIELKSEIKSSFYIDTVILSQNDPRVLGYSSGVLIRRKIQFNDDIQKVLTEYLSKSFSQNTDKKAIILVVDYIEVCVKEKNNIYLTLSFYEHGKSEKNRLLTVGAQTSGTSHFEVLISKAFQYCFDVFTEKLLDESSSFSVKTNSTKKGIYFPIFKVLEDDSNLDKGKFNTLGDFQYNNIKVFDDVELISINEGRNGYLIKINGKKEEQAFAVSDGDNMYFKLSKRYYKGELLDTNIVILANDQREIMDGIFVASYFGIAGGLLSLPFGQPGLFLSGLVVGAIIGHTVSTIIVKRRITNYKYYYLDVQNGKIKKI